jgi:hypothetical protein
VEILSVKNYTPTRTFKQVKNMVKIKLSARDVAFVGVFAALSVVVIRVIPGFPIIGLSESQIKFDAAIAPIYGMILGPYLGCLAAFIGGIVLANSWFSVLTSFAPAASALVAGLLTQKKLTSNSRSFPAWATAAIIIGLLILGWYATWVGQNALLYPVLHIAALLVILVFRGRIATAFENSEETRKGWNLKPNYILLGVVVITLAYVLPKPYLSWIEILSYLSLPLYFLGAIMILHGIFGGEEGKLNFVAAVSMASYCGIIADHMVGNLSYISLIGIVFPPEWLPDTPALFMSILPVSVVERIVFTAIATVFGVGLILALRRAGLFPRKLSAVDQNES